MTDQPHVDGIAHPSLSSQTSPIRPLTRDAHVRIHGHEVAVAGLEELVDFVAIDTQGVTLHAAVAGPQDGPLVVLLHGFPEFWYSWRMQIPALVEAGFRVVVPDQRGYNLSDKPEHVSAYRRDVLGRDILAIIDAFGRERAHVVGHDWGGGVAWWLGEHAPQRLDKLAVLNCPHVAVMSKALTSDPRQMKMSWYIGLFQVPRLAEYLFRRDDYSMGVRALHTTVRKGIFSPEEISLYRDAWARPNALSGMLNWYRAAKSEALASDDGQLIDVPTLLIWGEKDIALHRSLAAKSIARCRKGQLEYLPRASHWVMQDAPDEVNRLLTGFLSA
jgi:epoxide hydrolase 4